MRQLAKCNISNVQKNVAKLEKRYKPCDIRDGANRVFFGKQTYASTLRTGMAVRPGRQMKKRNEIKCYRENLVFDSVDVQRVLPSGNPCDLLNGPPFQTTLSSGCTGSFSR